MSASMSLFSLLAGLLLAGVLALLLWPLLRSVAGPQSGRHSAPSTGTGPETSDESAAADDRQSANLRILREQSRQLDAELAQGLLSAAQHQAAHLELARRTLQESPESPESSDSLSPPKALKTSKANKANKAAASAAVQGRRPGQASWLPRSRGTALLLGLLLPALAVGLYSRLGTPAAMNPAVARNAATPDADVTLAQVEAMVSTMAERLEKMPPGQADAKGWEMLARSLAALQRYPEADRAYARAIDMAPDNAQLLADRADVLVLLQDRRSAGEPTRLIEKALQLEPDNLKALALAGSAAFERQDFAAAVLHWGRARALATPGSDFAAGLDRSLQAARSSAGPALSAAPKVALQTQSQFQSQPQSQPQSQAQAQAQAPQTADPHTANKKTADKKTADNQARQTAVSGTISLAPALRARVQPGDTLFVFARAADGPRMPLAILRLPASNLPASFTLDDSLAMSPEFKLSRFDRVVVYARISRSGDALPQPGDLVGQTAALKTGTRQISLQIAQVQP